MPMNQALNMISTINYPVLSELQAHYYQVIPVRVTSDFVHLFAPINYSKELFYELELLFDKKLIIDYRDNEVIEKALNAYCSGSMINGIMNKKMERNYELTRWN